MECDTALAAVGIVLHFLGFIYYGKCALAGKVNPSLASWEQWAVLGILLAVSSHVMNKGDVIKSLQAYGICIANVIMVVVVLIARKYDKPKLRDTALSLFGLLAIFLWWLKHDATYALLTLLFPVVISIIPTWINTWQEPSREDPKPWLVICFSYLLTGTATALRVQYWTMEWHQVALHVTGFATQFVVPLIAILKKNR